MKKCTKCNTEKELNKFYKKKGGRLGLDAKCKDCVAKYHSQRFQDNKTEIVSSRKSYMKKYRENNKEDISEYNKKYYSKNKDKIAQRKSSREYRDKMNSYQKAKYYSNDNYRMMSCLRARVNAAIRKSKGKKTNKTENLLGCDINFLKQYIAKQFTKGMSWQNYGEWHIDHIKPCAAFDLTKESEQKKCFHYSNLQPLWADENIRKRDKIK